jgi:hypothetical protein
MKQSNDQPLQHSDDGITSGPGKDNTARKSFERVLGKFISLVTDLSI